MTIMTRNERTGEALAVWNATPYVDANIGANDSLREMILSDAYQFSAYAVDGGHVLLVTPLGKTLVRPRVRCGVDLLEFDHLTTRNHPARVARRARVRFWMNLSSIADLGDRLRAAPEKRCPFDSFFTT